MSSSGKQYTIVDCNGKPITIADDPNSVSFKKLLESSAQDILSDVHINEIVDSSLLNQDVSIENHELKQLIDQTNSNMTVKTEIYEELDDGTDFTIIDSNGTEIIITGNIEGSEHIFKMEEEARNSLECSKCFQTFSSKSELSQHKSFVHKEVAEFQCHVCLRIFPSKKAFEKHELSKICSPTEAPYCQMCNRYFKNQSQYDKHRRLHESPNEIAVVKNEANFFCDDCGKAFRLATSLQRHRKLHSSDIKPCPECGKAFCDRATLENHLRSHTGEKPFECTICNKRFGHASNLNKHKRIHAGLKPYKCNSCDKRFSELNYVKIHERTHTGDKPHKCNLCDRSFAATNSLASHKRTHFNNTSFKCEICKEEFGDNAKLLAHIQASHVEKATLFCPVCCRFFTSSGHLSIHMKSHNSDKKHQCSVCAKKFETTTLLKDHMNEHKKHRKNLYRRESQSSAVLEAMPITNMKKINYQCSSCNKYWSDLNSLHHHQPCNAGNIEYEDGVEDTQVESDLQFQKLDNEIIVDSGEIYQSVELTASGEIVVDEESAYEEYEVIEDYSDENNAKDDADEDEHVILIHPDDNLQDFE